MGMSLHLHYCCGKLDKVDLSSIEHNCSNKLQFKDKSCCDDRQIDLKIKTAYNLEKFVQSQFHFDAITALQIEASPIAPTKSSRLIPEVFAPPPLKDRTVLFCVYRI